MAEETPHRQSPTAQTILVVEDEQAVAEVLVSLLEAEGYRVSQASNGYDALEMLGQEHPDLILSDIMMPGVDGIAMCRALQERPAYRMSSDIPVILMSAAHGVAQRSCKFEAFVAKPFELDYLLNTISQVLAHRWSDGSS